jgi:hypothetical protein
MNRQSVLQRSSYLMMLSTAVWLVVGGVAWAGDGAALSTTPRVVETEWPGVTLELTSIEPASGNTLVVRFQYVNNGSDTVKISHSVYNILQRIYYVDTIHHQRYGVARSTTGMATIIGTDRPGPVSLEPGQAASFWVEFPAPPAGVERVNLHFPGALPMENVPIR